MGNGQGATFGVVLVSAPSKEVAIAIATLLVNAKLAACVSLSPICSIYTWQGEVHTDDEWQLVIKTKLDQFEAIAAKVRENHPYEVPEIIALPIVAGSSPYLSWIADSTLP